MKSLSHSKRKRKGTFSHIALWVQFDEELFALEAEFADLGPGKGVYLGHALKHQDPQVGHGQVEGHSFVVLHTRNR